MEKTVRTDIRTTPSLKDAYARYCKRRGETVSERTRALWFIDMASEGPPEYEDAQEETA